MWLRAVNDSWTPGYSRLIERMIFFVLLATGRLLGLLLLLRKPFFPTA
jgi:hypothetical protein